LAELEGWEIGDLCEERAESLELTLRELDAKLDQRTTRLATGIAARESLKQRLNADSSEAKSRLTAAEREIARLGVEVARRRAKAEHARRLRICAKAFQELQVRLRERSAEVLAERSLALYAQLSNTQEIKTLKVDPESYAVLVKSKDMGSEAPAYLSQGGGHRQLLGLAFRLALARMVGDPPFLLLDEPTDGLDAHHRDRLIERLQSVDAAKQLLVVTHQDQITGGHRIRIQRDGAHSRSEIVA
jgi:DNA sulfur modification protein DndD